MSKIDKIVGWTQTTIIYYKNHYELNNEEKREYLKGIIEWCEGELKNGN